MASGSALSSGASDSSAVEQRIAAAEELLRKQGRRLSALAKKEAELAEAAARLEHAVADMRATVDQVARHASVVPALRQHAATIERQLQGLLRLQTLKPDELSYPFLLTVQRFHGSSQRDEDGLTLAILREAGVQTRTFVELGCGDNGGNSGWLATELGWKGLMVDASDPIVRGLQRRLGPSGITVASHWITRENVNELLQSHSVADEVDLLSVDIDGNDYWVWEALSACSPRLVIVEYNSAFGPERSAVVPYRPDFVRDSSICRGLYFGASLRALARLAHRKGYRLVATENVNAFFLRNDVAPGIPACDVNTAYELYSKHEPRLDALGQDYFAVLRKKRLPLAEAE
jgi:hypothetical protein